MNMTVYVDTNSFISISTALYNMAGQGMVFNSNCLYVQFLAMRSDVVNLLGTQL